MGGIGVRLVVEIVNHEAVEALEDAIRLVEEVAEDMPWQDDLREAVGKLEAARRGLVTRRIR